MGVFDQRSSLGISKKFLGGYQPSHGGPASLSGPFVCSIVNDMPNSDRVNAICGDNEICPQNLAVGECDASFGRVLVFKSAIERVENLNPVPTYVCNNASSGLNIHRVSWAVALSRKVSELAVKIDPVHRIHGKSVFVLAACEVIRHQGIHGHTINDTANGYRDHLRLLGVEVP